VSWLAEQTGVDVADALTLAKQGLLHDADESFLPDVATPIKVLPEFAFFREAGQKIFRTVMAEFGLPLVEDPRVKTADRVMLVTEKRDLMSPKAGWEQDYKEQAANFHIIPLSPKRAKRQFLARYNKLFGKGFNLHDH
jgi:5'-deoxynucleotidase YfbR-like HD superfamily hydrolase